MQPNAHLNNQATENNNISYVEDISKYCVEAHENSQERKLVTYNIKEFLSLNIPLRKMILSPIIPEQGLVMIYASRGIGKTYLSLSIAYPVACGGNLFEERWKCESPRKVLFIDGEMPASLLQERLRNLASESPMNLENDDNLKILTSDLQDHGIQDLSTVQGQESVEKFLEDADLIIIDNLSSLCRSGRENESESWMPLQEWLLSLRRRGKSVLLIHHAGKSGNQRGTSKKEDLLDTVISLKRPEAYDSEEGARFEIHYEKTRSFYGKEAKPFEVCLQQDNKRFIWQAKDVSGSEYKQTVRLSEQGFSQRKIAHELGISLSTVNRHLKKAKEEIKNGVSAF